MKLSHFKFLTAIVFILVLFCFKLNCFSQNKTASPNIILIIVDDLRPELEVYGNNIIKTPHINALAQDGMIFKNAYCNVPVCGASRASMLTGLRPNNNRFLTFKTKISEDAPKAITFPKLLKSKGYNTFSYNKVAHHKYDAKGSWNQEWYPYLKNGTTKASFIGWKDYQLESNRIDLINNNPTAVSERVDGDDTIYFDGQTTQKVISDLNELQNSNTPFFMAVGYVKPHLPFNAPSKYWDLYKENNITLPVNHIFPESVPKVANHKWGELRSYNKIPKEGPIDDGMAKHLIHGYYACVSYIDAQIGKLVDTLKQLDVYDDTYIMLVSDHGWSLSEHGLWAKHSNFEKALKIPFIIKGPGVKKGSITENYMELIDIYPTICDLTEIEKPQNIDGNSFLETLNKPKKITKSKIFSKWKNGETVIKDNWAFTKWTYRNKANDKMLFNHADDPDEMSNLVGLKKYHSISNSLETLLDTHLKKRK